MRKGELFRLRPEDLNFSSETVTRIVKGEVWEVHPSWLLIEKSKNGRPRAIPMSERVRRILKMLSEDATAIEYVFSSIRTKSRIDDIEGFRERLPRG